MKTHMASATPPFTECGLEWANIGSDGDVDTYLEVVDDKAFVDCARCLKRTARRRD